MAHAAQRKRGIDLKPIHIPTYRYEHVGGYIILRDPTHINAGANGNVLEHIAVMADHLGRRIRTEDGENVHHINGKRDDNRLENLELWVSSQPKGQRVIDLLAWADWIHARYDPERASLLTQ